MIKTQPCVNQIVSHNHVYSPYFEDRDVCHNLNSWKPGGNNILFITGLSGGGKSTISEDISKSYNAQYIPLDLVTNISMIGYPKEKKYLKYTQMKEMCPDAAAYFDNPTNICEVASWANDEDHIKMTRTFVSWFMNNYHGNNTLYIIEGIQLCGAYDADYFKPYPIIVKGTPLTQSLFRRSIRSYRDTINDGFVKAFKTFVESFILFSKKKYMDKVKLFRSFKDGISNITKVKMVGPKNQFVK